jgi:hypothetical protein
VYNRNMTTYIDPTLPDLDLLDWTTWMKVQTAEGFAAQPEYADEILTCLHDGDFWHHQEEDVTDWEMALNLAWIGDEVGTGGVQP